MLSTLRTYLRPYTEEDIERIYPVLSDPVTMQFWPEPLTRQQVETYVQTNITRMEECGLARMIAESHETGEVIGSCGIVQTTINGTMENDLGYIVHHPFWQQGYATEWGEALIAFARNQRMERVVANMATDHIGSRRVAEKIGMRLEKTFFNQKNLGKETCLYALDLR